MKATVSTLDLLSTLRTNRQKHIETYQEAVQAYRAKLIEHFEQVAELLRETAETDEILGINIAHRLPRPEVHVDDYDRAIGLVGWHTEDTIELDEHQFNQLVLDDWGWKASFTSNTASYASSR